MKILGFGDLKTGCWLARIARPLSELANNGNDVYFTNGLAPFSLHGWDIVVFNNLLDAPTVVEDGVERESSYKEMLDELKRNGAKIVYDTDDAQDIIPAHSLNKEKAKELLKSFDLFLKEADLITTTTEELKKYLKTRTDKPIIVLPNSLNPKEFKLKIKHSRLRVGMAGSSSHLLDLLSVIDDLIILKKKYDFDFHLFGFAGDWEEFKKKTTGTGAEKAVKDLGPKLKELGTTLHKPVKSWEYPQKLSELGLEIGICPLIEDKFNRNKSCIKFYEYSLVGTCAIASDVLPYSEEPVLKAEDWVNDLERLIVDEDFRKQERFRMRAWVLENRDITKNWILWEEAYQNICS